MQNSNTAPLLEKQQCEKAKPPSQLVGLYHILKQPICVLLIFWPLGILSYVQEWGDQWTFLLNFLAMIPLAQLLGDATEELAIGIQNDTIGGLLNATFGNAVEMILTVKTLQAGLFSVVKATLLGSILSNLLLVLGSALLVGGYYKKVMNFSVQAAMANMTLLAVSVASLAFPGVFENSAAVQDYTPDEPGDLTLKVSRWASCYILISYIAFLYFQMYTHADQFASDQEEGEAEVASIRPVVSTGLLIVSTILVAVSSEFLVDSIDGMVSQLGIGKAFVGMILLPIVGNACEHFSAIRMAAEDKLDITIGIAVGSATQIALFVVPFSVLVGWAMNVPMDLNFDGLNTIVLACSVFIAFSILLDGEGNWLEGFMLVISYFMVGTLYWFYPEE